MEETVVVPRGDPTLFVSKMELEVSAAAGTLIVSDYKVYPQSIRNSQIGN